MYVLGNPRVLSGLSWDGLRWAFETRYSGLWTPLAWLSHMTDVSVWGMQPGGHHLTSVLIHAASTLLLYGLLTYTTTDHWRAALVSLLFAIHPMHIESVAWVAERKDVLVAFFFILTLGCHALRVRTGQRSWTVAMYLAAVAAGLAKPMAISLPLALVLMDIWPLKRVGLATEPLKKLMSLAVEKWPLFLLASLLALNTLSEATDTGTRPVSADELFTLTQRLQLAGLAYGYYIIKALWPFQLSFYYPANFATPLWLSIVPPLLLVLALTVLWRQRSRYPALLCGTLWYVITLLPVSGIVQIASYAYADRYSYLPHIGLFIGLAWSIPVPANPRHKHLGAALLGTLLVALLALAHWQASHWKTSESLYSRALSIDPTNRLARLALAHTYVRKGDSAQASELIQSLLVETGGPISAQAFLLAGDIEFFKGNRAQAAAGWQTAARADTKYWRPHLRQGTLALEDAHPEQAIRHFLEADRLNPRNAEVLNNLGVAQVRLGNIADAHKTYLRALESDGRNPTTLLNLARSYERMGAQPDARRHYEELQRIDPGNQGARAGLMRLDGAPLR